jgi:DNA-binding SARP family transcriptional activator/TolB-like protein
MIELRALGTVELKGTDGAALRAVLAQPKRFALLAYLAVHHSQGPRRRDAVIALFWPELDTEHARGALRQALRFLRRSLGAGVLNGRSEEELAIEEGTLWCDATAFEEACAAARWAQALELYRGDFFDSFFVSGGSAELDRWVESQRTRCRTLAHTAARALADGAEQARDFPAAAHMAQRALEFDPDDERSLRQLVRLLDAVGDRAGALSAYEQFRSRVAQLYDATPAPETEARIRSIRERQTAFPDPGRQRVVAPVAAAIPAARRPRGGLRSGRRLLWVGASAMGLAALWSLIGPRERTTSIAVLPLVNTTPDTTLEYLATGLTEGATAALSRLPGVRVAARASVQPYGASAPDAQEVGRRLGVDDVLAWSLAQAGDSLILRAELVEFPGGARRWAGEFRLAATDALAVEGRVIGDVVSRLRPGLADSTGLRQLRRTTASAEAYLLYLQGRYFLSMRTPQGIARARGLFAQAIDRDPVYAAAYAGLGYSYGAMAFYGLMPSREAFPLLEAAARRALEIDSTLGFAHALVAQATSSYHWQWAAAEPAFRHAVELDANDPDSHNLFALYLRILGRFDEAEVEARRAVELDPLTRHYVFQLGRVQACAGRPADAAVQYAKQLALDSIYPAAHEELAQALASQGMYDAALPELAAAVRQSGDTGLARRIAAKRGRAGYAAALMLRAGKTLEDLRIRARRGFVRPVSFADVLIQLGNREESIGWLRRAFDDGDVALATINCSPEYASLQGDPRFMELRRRMGLR